MNARSTRKGFTLVELMIAIAIIAILMTLTITAVTRAIGRGRETAARLEINALAQAAEQYNLKYGDYPPDGSSYAVLSRHMGKIFPRMSPQDSALLNQLVQDRSSGDFSYVAMDRAEALVFFLGGFSENVLFPLTGEGGPLKLRSGLTNPTELQLRDLANYEYNGTRDNAFFDFDPDRLTLIKRVNDSSPLLSIDEALLGLGNSSEHGGNDPLPVYLAREGVSTPLVYFDSRTYGGVGPGVFNGYLAGMPPNATEFGGIRPYMTTGTGEIQFHNPSTFQIISPGSDGVFGACISHPNSPAVYFVTQTGEPANVNGQRIEVAGQPVFSKFQDSGLGFSLPLVTVNGHLDNLTNFSSSTLESDLP